MLFVLRLCAVTVMMMALSCGRGEAERPAETGAIPAPSDVSAPPADAARTASGLASKVLEAGQGTRKPTARSRVKAHYTGWTTDGTMFDSSVTKGEPLVIALNQVIPGWTEGMQLMVEGEKRRFWIPSELAYDGAPGAPAGMLVFDVELLEIQDPPSAPADVAAPPADAGRAPSGLAFKVLAPGTGTAHPGSSDHVRVHYTGWTADGELFDSTYSRGEPATIPIADALSGFRQGVQLMVEGEKRRLWIPEDLAFKGQAGAPRGMLVFDVELLSIVK